MPPMLALTVDCFLYLLSYHIVLIIHRILEVISHSFLSLSHCDTTAASSSAIRVNPTIISYPVLCANILAWRHRQWTVYDTKPFFPSSRRAFLHQNDRRWLVTGNLSAFWDFFVLSPRLSDVLLFTLNCDMYDHRRRLVLMTSDDHDDMENDLL